MSIKRLAAGTFVASAAVLMLGTGNALAEITLDQPSATPEVQAPQPIAGSPYTGSQGFVPPGCTTVAAAVFC
ncbi:hypothetical protein GPX89_35835 [Nocardia sp. ET3-3]|uniref:Secreted protein n=1 Tax=Nocardia terrae TaxID=2675851 RepID=A0A7K1V7G3_9NOCA|nr:hypothetical protein [Nocardia terrae]MVU82590.1 hypothetical protein [Nocardia terrae]